MCWFVVGIRYLPLHQFIIEIQKASNAKCTHRSIKSKNSRWNVRVPTDCARTNRKWKRISNVETAARNSLQLSRHHWHTMWYRIECCYDDSHDQLQSHRLPGAWQILIIWFVWPCDQYQCECVYFIMFNKILAIFLCVSQSRWILFNLLRAYWSLCLHQSVVVSARYAIHIFAMFVRSPHAY